MRFVVLVCFRLLCWWTYEDKSAEEFVKHSVHQFYYQHTIEFSRMKRLTTNPPNNQLIRIQFHSIEGSAINDVPSNLANITTLDRQQVVLNICTIRIPNPIHSQWIRVSGLDVLRLVHVQAMGSCELSVVIFALCEAVVVYGWLLDMVHIVVAVGVGALGVDLYGVRKGVPEGETTRI